MPKKLIITSIFMICSFALSSADPGFDLSFTGVISENMNYEYPFKPGDGLYINTFPDTTSFLNQVFPIDYEGYVYFPIIGRVNIIEMSTSEIIQFIKNKFKPYIRSKVIVVKPMCRIAILGGIVHPGLYYFDYNTPFWSAIHYVGGATHEFGIKKMLWERNRKIISDNLIPDYESGTTLKNMGVKSGDQFTTRSTCISKMRNFVAVTMPLIASATAMVFFYLNYKQRSFINQLIIR